MKFSKFHILLVIIFTSCSRSDIIKQIKHNNKTIDYSIYNEVINDSNNFFLFPEDKFSDIKYVIQESKHWEKERFFLSNENILGELLRGEDELSDYNTTYLFSKNEGYISKHEKQTLANYSENLKLDTIQTEFSNLIKISKKDTFEGICFQLARPIYSSNNKSVFLDIYLHQNRQNSVLDPTSYYEKIGFILEKDSLGKWKTIERKLWIML